MLRTNLEHVETDQGFKDLLAENGNVMICCGRMGPMCLPVYYVMEKLQGSYPDVVFRDMDFDGPAAHNIRRLPQVRSFNGLPFTVYFRDGEVVEATTSIQTRAQISEILDRCFSD